MHWPDHIICALLSWLIEESRFVKSYVWYFFWLDCLSNYVRIACFWSHAVNFKRISGAHYRLSLHSYCKAYYWSGAAAKNNKRQPVPFCSSRYIYQNIFTTIIWLHFCCRKLYMAYSSAVDVLLSLVFLKYNFKQISCLALLKSRSRLLLCLSDAKLSKADKHCPVINLEFRANFQLYIIFNIYCLHGSIRIVSSELWNKQTYRDASSEL